jgi:pyruvate,water dikinase
MKGSVVLSMHDALCKDARLTGGKGSSLAFLAGVPNVSVPPFFVVTSAAFTQMFSDEETTAMIAVLQEQTVYARIDEESKRLRRHVRQKPLPSSVESDIAAAYSDMCERMGQQNVSVAVRSSATTEDLADASFAGQHSTYLNQKGAGDVLRSVRKCWASVFNSRAAEYRNKHNIGHLKALLCVVVQVMVNPVVAGTAFSCELATGFPSLNVSALWGLGEGLVSGDITADDYLFAPTPPYRCIRRTMGSKTHQFQFRPGASGIELVPVAPEQQREWCLSLELAREIAVSLASVHEFYTKTFGYEYVDTELAVARVAGQRKVFFLQCRAVVPIAKKSIFTVESGFSEDVILTGRYSLPGAVFGRVNVVNFEALAAGSAAISADDIVVAVKTGNAWTPFLKTLKGLITEEGSGQPKNWSALFVF